MCVAKKPKIKATDPEKEKDPPVLRNPILDGMLGNIAALRNGRNALRINLLNPLAIPVGGGGGNGVGGGSSSGGGTSGGGTTSGDSSSYSGGTATNPTPTTSTVGNYRTGRTIGDRYL